MMNKQIKELLDEVIEIKESLEQLEEKEKMFNYVYDTYNFISGYLAEDIELRLIAINYDKETYKQQLNNLYSKKELKTMQTLQIIQWGSERSIVLLTYTDTKEQEYLLIDNDYLLNLDEMGVLS